MVPFRGIESTDDGKARAFFTVKVESHLTGKENFHPIRREEFIKVGMQIFFLQKRRLVQQSTLQDEILNMRPLF